MTPTRDEWETRLTVVFLSAAEAGGEACGSSSLTRALLEAGAWDVHVIRNALSGRTDVPEAVIGRVLDHVGVEHEFEARRPPFEQTFRWVSR